MLAVRTRVRPYTGAEAEFAVAYELGPFVILEVGSKCVAKDEPTDGIPVAIY